MTSYDQIRSLFDAVADLPSRERRAFLDKQDITPQVRAEVLELLQAFESQTGLFDRSPITPEAEALAPMTVPPRIGAYRIDSQIGSGGMGVVYRAFRDDDVFEKRVAIKLSRMSAPESEFRRERQILAGLEHPSIARLLDGGSTEDGLLYLVMEYVEGEPLLDYAKTHQLDIRQRVTLFRQICEAVEYAHRNLVVHRDLKPSNILVEADGNPKLLDFGIARAVSPGPEAAATTVFGMTPRYASPEQILHKPATTATDVYSLGVILFELLTDGGFPYAATSDAPGEIVEATLFAEPKTPSLTNPAIDRDVDHIVLKTLQRDTQLRYAGAAQLREDLDRYLSGHPVLAREAGAWYGINKFVRRNRLATAASVLAIAALAGAAFGITREARIANEQRVIAEQRRVEAEASSKQALQLLEEQRRLRTEADRSAEEALKQRTTAEQRLGTAQSLASSLLYDAYDSVRLLQGPAEARLKIIDKALQALGALAKESPGDQNISHALALAYERAADLALGITSEGISTASVALQHYRRAAKLHEGVCEICRAAVLARVALCHSQLGNTVEARESIQTARAIMRSHPQGPQRQEAVATIDDAECFVSQYTNSTAEAEAICLRAAGAMAASTGPMLLVRRGAIFSMLGITAKNANEIDKALRFANAATASYAECLKQDPGRADCDRGQAQIAGYLAMWQTSIGGPNAEQAYRDALSAMRRISGQARKTTLLDLVQATVAMHFAELLYAKGRTGEARDAARESFALREARLAIGKPTMFDLNDMADNLLKCPIPDMRDDAKALRYAEQAVELTSRKSPFVLSTLADALFANRRRDEAIRTAQEALGLLDKQNVPALRKEINQSLERFRAKLQ